MRLSELRRHLKHGHHVWTGGVGTTECEICEAVEDLLNDMKEARERLKDTKIAIEMLGRNKLISQEAFDALSAAVRGK